MVFHRGRNTTVTFLWRPFMSNLTDAFEEVPTLLQQPPAHIITGVALWDVLHVTDTSQYAQESADLAKSILTILQVCSWLLSRRSMRVRPEVSPTKYVR